MPGSSRQHRGEKRRKELARQARQQEKRQRRTERKEAGGAGPPIDWDATVGTAPGAPTTEPADGGPTIPAAEDDAPAEQRPADARP
jgi:hypothetical protein